MSKTSSIRCLITAGPTREYFDPVRFISNPSSGKMGFALAEAAIKEGWTVDLVSGPVEIKEPKGVIFYPVTSAKEMFNQVDALFDVCDILIMTAAVSDFSPKKYSKNKIKIEKKAHSIELEPNKDILKTMCDRKSNQMVIGFAAETDSLEINAKSKLHKKGCDWIIANYIGDDSYGFGKDNNKISIFKKDGLRIDLGPSTKIDLAKRIVQDIGVRFR